MNIDMNEFAARVYRRQLRLMAETEVLKVSVLTLFENVKPGSSDRVKEEIEKHVEDRLQQLLMNDNYLKGDWDQYFRCIFSGHQD